MKDHPTTACPMNIALTFRLNLSTVSLLIATLSSGCEGDPAGPVAPEEPAPVVPEEPAEESTFSYVFNTGAQGFTAGFADYPPEHAEIYELTSGFRLLPAPLNTQAGLYISGVNRSDDLFMFYKGPIDGLSPDVRYSVTLNLEIATAVPSGCFGVGGAPGESVWIKAGVSTVEPVPVLQGTHLRMNIDIGSQSNGGEHAIVFGNIANSRNCEQPRQWELKAFGERLGPAVITAPSSGRVWLLFGVDSGFECLTETYFTRAWVTFTPL